MFGTGGILWSLVVLVVCGEVSALQTMNEGKIKQVKRKSDSSVSQPSPTFTAALVCKLFPDFTPEQRNFCMTYPQVVSAIAVGVQNGLHECEERFKHHRWNCTSTFPETASFGQNRAAQGTQEAAFTNAIVSAGVAHSVTSACARKNITGCICVKNKGTTQSTWEDGGCTNNIANGIEISKTFLDGSRGVIREAYKLQIRHNREAGRMAVRNSVDFRCNCHGVSGACTSRTCWETLSFSFERVGRALMQRYGSAIKVKTKLSHSRVGRVPIALILPNSGFLKPSADQLVYLEESPLYCEPDSKKGVAGTKGRVCDHMSKGLDGCKHLCCGRGYNRIEFVTVTRCNCQFHWCCKVNCQKCKIKKQRTVCK